MRKRIIQEVLDKKIISIVRGVEPEKILKIAEALYEGGVTLIEVTFNQKDPDSWAQTAVAINAIHTAMGDKMFVGAGTVTSVELVEMAAKAGAGYIISPDTDPAVIRRTKELGLVSLPGAYTPTEAKLAHNSGADFVKLFPCVGDAPAYLKAVCAPMSHIKFLAVGGVNADNAADFLKAGAVGIGAGSCLVNKKWVVAGEYYKITEEAKRFVANLSK